MTPHTPLLITINKEAEQSASRDGLEAYSAHLSSLLTGEQPGAPYVRALADRITTAELMARQGTRSLVSEDAVAKAFNTLMAQVEGNTGPRFQTTPATVHRLRLALEPTDPAVISVESHSDECLPAEAIFVLTLLVWNNGTTGNPPVTPAVHSGNNTLTVRSGPRDARTLLLLYSQSHPPRDRVKLFDEVATILAL